MVSETNFHMEGADMFAAIVEYLGKPPRNRLGLIHIHECAL